VTLCRRVRRSPSVQDRLAYSRRRPLIHIKAFEVGTATIKIIQRGRKAVTQLSDKELDELCEVAFDEAKVSMRPGLCRVRLW
jgi:hypothetical protein